MYVWELHEALARSLNDPYSSYWNDFPYLPYQIGSSRKVEIFCGDGMRFSSLQRSIYLDRAITSILRDAIMQVIHLPRVHASSILQKLFPTLTQVYTTSMQKEWSFEHLWVYSVVIAVKGVYAKTHSPRDRTINSFNDGEYININVPLYSEVEAKNLFGVQSKIRPELVAFCIWKPNLIAFYGERINDLTNGYADNKMHVTFMKKPKKIVNSTDREEVEFDDLYFDNIIQRATLYGLHDSGLLGSANIAMSLLDTPTIKVGSFIPNNSGVQEQ